MTKKKVLALALVVCMIAILSYSTLAWFTDSQTNTNDFTVNGGGENDPDKIFSVGVLENVDGEDVPVDGTTFTDILPGDSFKKEAFVSNTGSYEQYIRVTMTVTDWALLKDIITLDMDDNFSNNWVIDTAGVSVDANGNLAVDANVPVDNDGNLVVVMYLNLKLAANQTIDIMDLVNISADATQDNFAADGFKDGFQISFKADAAQTENILTTTETEEWKNAKATFEALGI